MTDAPGLEIPADLLLPESGTGPGLVLLQEIFGVTDYIGSRARDLADQAGFPDPSFTERESDEPEGTVIDQSPNAGKKVDRGTAIKLTLAKEPEPEPDPDPDPDPTPTPTETIPTPSPTPS